MQAPTERRAAVVVLGGLVAGISDLTFAFVFYGLQGATPDRILQAIASGALGRQSFQLGALSCALGAVFHFLISVSAATIYYAASRRLRVMTRHLVMAGASFGVVVFGFMNFIVKPLSAVRPMPLRATNVIGELCSHVVFGIIIAVATSRARRPCAHAPPARTGQGGSTAGSL